MWHVHLFQGDKNTPIIGAFLFEIQNRLLANISYTIIENTIQKYLTMPFCRLYLSSLDLKEVRKLIERKQYGVTSDYYHMTIAAVFRYKVLVGEICLSLFENPISAIEIRKFWKTKYSNQEGLEQVLCYMERHNIPSDYTIFIKYWYDFVLQEMNKPYAFEALGWLIRSFIENDKWCNNNHVDYIKELMWQYADYAKLVVVREYPEIRWRDEWKDGLDKYNELNNLSFF